MKNTVSRARVGLLVFIGVVAFAVGVFTVGEKSQLFNQTFTVRVNFNAAEGVKPGTIVFLSGYQVGVVREIALNSNADSVTLTLSLNQEIRPFIKPDSKAEVQQEGLVGNKVINIFAGTPKAPLVEDGGYIQGIPPFAIGNLVDNFTSIVDTTKLVAIELNNTLRLMNEGKGTMGKLLTQDDVYRNLLKITETTDQSIKLTTKQINQLTATMDKAAKAIERGADRIDTTVQSINTLTMGTNRLIETLNTNEGTLGALINDRALYDTLVAFMNALRDATHDAGNTADQAAKAVYAMRSHWLLGRFMGGESMKEETPPKSSYQARQKELLRRQQELEEWEKRLKEREDKQNQSSGR